MRLSDLMALVLVSCAAPAAADPLAGMQGSWRGEGWARETPEGPREKIRCRLDNTYDAATQTLTVKGKCAVPGRQLTLSGTLTGTDATPRVTGRWFNPNGLGSVGVVGIQRDGIVAFNFAAKDSKTGRDVAQNVEWRVRPGQLRLRSTDRKNPDIMVSDVTFTP